MVITKQKHTIHTKNKYTKTPNRTEHKYNTEEKHQTTEKRQRK